VPSLGDYLARCPRCHATCIMVYGRASYKNLALFEPVPWSPLDETPADESLSEAAYKRWRQQLPYKLYICYIDFELGQWEVAMVRSNDKLRTGAPLWKPHRCPLEESDGVEPTKADVLPDLKTVAVDGEERRVPVAPGNRRARNPRLGRARDGG